MQYRSKSIMSKFLFLFFKNKHAHAQRFMEIHAVWGNDLPSPSPSSISGPPLPYLLLIIFLQSLTMPHTPHLHMYTDIGMRVDTIK